MPYIKNREQLDDALKPLLEVLHNLVPGDYNYIITRILHQYVINNGGLCYTNINSVIGILECAKQEFYRVVAAPYEDIKRMENDAITDLDAVENDEKQTN